MKKLIISTIYIVLSSIIFNACSTISMNTKDKQTTSFTYFKHEIPLTKVHKTIVKVGKENGWRITEFKENEVIAEKEKDGNMKAVTITFSESYFDVLPRDSDLYDTLEKELNN